MSALTDFDRSSGIGASEVAVVLGLDPRRSQFDLWLEKVGRKAPFAGNRFTELGHKFEPIIADAYAEQRGLALEETVTRRHPAAACVFATPDRLVVGSPLGVECKAVFSPHVMREYGETGSRDFPPRVAAQCLMQAAVFDLDAVDLVAFIAGDIRVYRVDRDRALEQRVLDRLCGWWETHVLACVAPPIDGSDKALDWIQDRFPSPTRGILRADAPELVQLLSDLRDAKRDVDAAKDRFDVLKNNVCAVIADASGIEADGVGSVTWRKAADKAVTDWEAVGAGAGPDVIAAHTTVRTGTRRFLCNFPNGKE